MAAAVAAWAVFLPQAAPLLARLGLPAAEGAAPASAGRQQSDDASTEDRVTVIGSEVTASESAGRVSAIGDGRAIHLVSVTPLVSGRLTSLDVASGARSWPRATSSRVSTTRPR